MICDLDAPVSKSTNLSHKNHLLSQVEVDGLEGTEWFETFTEGFQTLICYFVASINKSTDSSDENHLRLEVDIDGL